MTKTGTHLEHDHAFLGLEREVDHGRWRGEVEDEDGVALDGFLGALARRFRMVTGLFVRAFRWRGHWRDEVRGRVAGEGRVQEEVVNELLERR